MHPVIRHPVQLLSFASRALKKTKPGASAMLSFSNMRRDYLTKSNLCETIFEKAFNLSPMNGGILGRSHWEVQSWPIKLFAVPGTLKRHLR